MNVSSVSQSVQSALVQKLGSKSSVSGSCESETSSAASSLVGSVTMSKPTEMFSQLQSLAESDPEKFKALASQISEQLSAAAESEGGQSASMLSNLASKFAGAAESGDASALEPPKHDPHQGGPKGPPPSGEAAGENAVSGQNARAMDAYKKNGPPELSDSAKSTLDSIFELVQQQSAAAT